MKALRTVSGPQGQHAVFVEWSLKEAGVLRVDWEVRSEVPIHSHPAWPKQESVWGLWEKDVCEIFLQLRPLSGEGADLPYFEFQVSPEGQFFELLVIEPRVVTNPHWSSQFRVGAQKVEKQGLAWKASAEIQLSTIGWKGEAMSLWGGVFACLGPQEDRSYHALFLPQQAEPDFHLPGEFGIIFTDLSNSCTLSN